MLWNNTLPSGRKNQNWSSQATKTEHALWINLTSGHPNSSWDLVFGYCVPRPSSASNERYLHSTFCSSDQILLNFYLSFTSSWFWSYSWIYFIPSVDQQLDFHSAGLKAFLFHPNLLVTPVGGFFKKNNWCIVLVNSNWFFLHFVLHSELFQDQSFEPLIFILHPKASALIVLIFTKLKELTWVKSRIVNLKNYTEECQPRNFHAKCSTKISVRSPECFG